MKRSVQQMLASFKGLVLIQSGMGSLPVRWGFLLILLIFFGAGVISPYGEWRQAYQDATQMKVEKLLRLQSLQSSSERWDASLKQHNASLSGLGKLFFQSSSAAASQAALLQLMRRLLNKGQLLLQSQKFIDAKPEPGLGERISLQLQLQGTLPEVIRFLDALSRHEKLMDIDELLLNRTGAMSRYTLRIQVSGFRSLGHAT